MIKTLRLSERFYLLFPRRIWNFVRYFVYPSYGEQRARLVRMTGNFDWNDNYQSSRVEWNGIERSQLIRKICSYYLLRFLHFGRNDEELWSEWHDKNTPSFWEILLAFPSKNLGEYFRIYPSLREQRARFVRMTVLVESNVRDSSSLLQLKLDTPRQAGWR